MINLFHNTSYKKNRGAAMLVITIILLVASTMIIIFAANQTRMLEKISSNQNRNRQAMQAALAGMEYGINYLQQNSTVILANPVSGYIPAYTSASTTNVTLANGSKFSITYINPVANNYKLIKITSTGTSDDGTATRTASQEVQFGSLIFAPPTVPITSKDVVTLNGHATITNTINNTTIVSAETVSLGGSSSTVLSSGTSSTAGSIKSDIQQNNASLDSMSQNDFFTSFFGVQQSTIQNNVAYHYSNSSNTNYSSTLNGLSGTAIWIDQTNGSTATINGNTTIGSEANPVLLIVNGNLNVMGNVKFYGFIFVMGTGTAQTDLTGNLSLSGAMVSSDDLNITGSAALNYDNSALSNLQNLKSLVYYAKVPGTWKDF